MAAPYIPLKPSGRADDLLGILVRAEETRYARENVVVPEKPAWKRAWLEPIGNLFGRALYAFIGSLPAKTLAEIQLAFWKKVATPNTFPFAAEDPRLDDARRLLRSLGGSREPAILCVFTHPPVRGEWLNLNIELTRQTLWVLPFLRGRTTRPKLIVAVDPFALDGFGLFLEGAYAGFMGSLHLGFDRLASYRGAVSRALVGFTSWSRIAWRLTSHLRRGGEAGIPLGGGVPTTSRALYSAKEFVWECRRKRPRGRSGADVLAALDASSADFRAFAASGLVGPALRKNAWRILEAWMLAVVAGAWGGDGAAPGGVPSADRGKLTPVGRRSALAVAVSMGLDAAASAEAVELFDRELARDTPYRSRLFRVLAGRVAGKGTPLLIVPLSHGAPPDVKITWGEPLALVDRRGEDVSVQRADGSRATAPIARVFRELVDRHLP
ncbi:MAG: hypothetical protein HY553_14480 [Elusimicrobia bacterium]|nr:hypothetical protein [Elusimicrobiota bacterium]